MEKTPDYGHHPSNYSTEDTTWKRYCKKLLQSTTQRLSNQFLDNVVTECIVTNDDRSINYFDEEKFLNLAAAFFDKTFIEVIINTSSDRLSTAKITHVKEPAIAIDMTQDTVAARNDKIVKGTAGAIDIDNDDRFDVDGMDQLMSSLEILSTRDKAKRKEKFGTEIDTSRLHKCGEIMWREGPKNDHLMIEDN